MDLLIKSTENAPKAGKELNCYEAFSSGTMSFTPAKVEEILGTVWNKEHGLTGTIPDLMKTRETVAQQIASLDPEMVGRRNKQYKVYISQMLQKDLHDLMKQRSMK